MLYAYHAAYYIPEASGADVPGTVGAALGGLTATLAGTRDTPGSVTATLGGLTASLSGVSGKVGTVAVTLGALSATLSGTRATSGSIDAPLGALSVSLAGSVAASATGAITCTLGALTATLAQYVPPPAVETGSWGPLLALVREARTYRPPPRPVACPNDGEPLELVRGRLHCRYDGWTG
jgi:hypothetical protein